jgi:hypothetical protein
MEIVKLIFWLLIIGISSTFILGIAWFIFTMMVNFWKIYCKENHADDDLYNGKYN